MPDSTELSCCQQVLRQVLIDWSFGCSIDRVIGWMVVHSCSYVLLLLEQHCLSCSGALALQGFTVLHDGYSKGQIEAGLKVTRQFLPPCTNRSGSVLTACLLAQT